jgi:type III pantothenate kinase
MGAHLLIDNSNSFTKFALSTKDGVRSLFRLPTSRLSARPLKTLLRECTFDAVVLCSVVPKKSSLLARIFAEYPLLKVSAAVDLGIGIDYPKPASIGADRLANAVAACSLFRPPCVVVDFGTAVSFDIISEKGCYVGGVIAPGLEAMTHYLHERTALLPQIKLLEPPGVIGKSTEHAMLAGAVYGYRGLVKEILAEIRRTLPCASSELQVLATGGYANLIAAGVPEISLVHPTLTLEGLRLIGLRHFGE